MAGKVKLLDRDPATFVKSCNNALAKGGFKK